MRVARLAPLFAALALSGCCWDPCAAHRCPPPLPPPCASPCAPRCGPVASAPAVVAQRLVLSGEGEAVLLQGQGRAVAGGRDGVVVLETGKGTVLVIGEGKEAEEGEEKDGKAKHEGATLPPAVRKALEALVPGGTVKEVETGRRDGHAIYEVELAVGGRTTEVVLDETGQALEWEIEIDPAAAPKPVIDAALGAAKGRVTGVAEIRGADKALREYQVDVKDGEVESEVRVSLEGKVLRIDRDED